MKVIVSSEVKAEFDLKKIEDSVLKIFKENNAPENVEAGVTVVSHKRIVVLAKTYLKETDEEAHDHPVLSFLTEEVEEEFIMPPDNEIHLGEIMVSYEKAKEYAEKNKTSLIKEICDLADHGALHLLGIHHD